MTTIRLNILGFFPEALNILLDLAEESKGITKFNVLQNMLAAHPERYIPFERHNVDFYNCYEEVHTFNKNDHYTFGVLGTRSKKVVYKFFQEKIGFEDQNFVNLIHPTAYVSSSAELSTGIQIDVLSSVSVLTKIGFGVNIKKHCQIGHHGKIGDYVTINPGVTVSGFVEIGNHTLIGTGVVIRDGIKIGSNCIIGMGSNVLKDIPDNCIAYGNPCEIKTVL